MTFLCTINLTATVYFCRVAIDEGFYYTDSQQHGIRVTSLDVPLACVATETQPATVFPAPLQPISVNVTAVAFNFYNNIWNTNYIMWYPYLAADADFKARFAVDFI